MISSQYLNNFLDCNKTVEWKDITGLYIIYIKIYCFRDQIHCVDRFYKKYFLKEECNNSMSYLNLLVTKSIKMQVFQNIFSSNKENPFFSKTLGTFMSSPIFLNSFIIYLVHIYLIEVLPGNSIIVFSLQNTLLICANSEINEWVTEEYVFAGRSNIVNFPQRDSQPCQKWLNN